MVNRGNQSSHINILSDKSSTNLCLTNLTSLIDCHIKYNRSVRVIDNAVAKDSVTNRLKVEEGNDLQVGAPMKGEVLEVKVARDDVVEKGQGT